MSWQDVQWDDLQFETATLELPEPDPITLRPLPPLADKNAYIRYHLQTRLLSTGSALCFIIGMIVFISAGTSQPGRLFALCFGALWLLLLSAFFLLKAAMDRREQQFKKEESRWLDWERRAYRAGLTLPQRKVLDRLLYASNGAAGEEHSSPKGRTKRELSVRVQQQEGE